MVKYHKSVSFLYVVITFFVLISLVVLTGSAKPQTTNDAVITQRWSGVDRFITAAEVARNSYPEGAADVYLGSYKNFADPMVAGQAFPAGPVLLGGTVPLHRETCKAMTDLQPLIITAIGGSSAIPASNLTTAKTCAEKDPDQQEARMLQLLNEERTDRGLNSLSVNSRLRGDSRAWAAKMANDGKISHSDRPSWFNGELWGENVAQATDADVAHQALMDSKLHRQNILGDWDEVAVGIVIYKNSIWAVQQFIRH